MLLWLPVVQVVLLVTAVKPLCRLPPAHRHPTPSEHILYICARNAQDDGNAQLTQKNAVVARINTSSLPYGKFDPVTKSNNMDTRPLMVP